MRDQVVQYLNELCEYNRQFLVLFILSTGILAVNSVSILFLTPGTASYVVAMLNYVALIPIVLGTGFVVVRCARLGTTAGPDDTTTHRRIK